MVLRPLRTKLQEQKEERSSGPARAVGEAGCGGAITLDGFNVRLTELEKSMAHGSQYA